MESWVLAVGGRGVQGERASKLTCLPPPFYLNFPLLVFVSNIRFIIRGVRCDASKSMNPDDGLVRLGSQNLTEDVKSLVFNHEFTRGKVTDDVMENFLENGQTGLSLNECVHITDASLRHIARNVGHSIKTLTLVDCSRITDGGIRALSENAKVLTKLDLTGCFMISRFGADALSRNCTTLSELELTECLSIDDSAIYSLLQSKSLNILTLADCHNVLFLFHDVSDFDREKATNPNLKSLCLRHTRVTDESIQNITELCSDLRILDLSWCSRITNQSAQTIGDKKYPNLFALNLWGCTALTDGGLSHLCRNLPKLSSLTLSECTGLTDQSIISIIAMAANVTSLNLWGCQSLSPASIQLLLRHSPKMQTLGLSYCSQINDAALEGISQKVSQLKAIQFEQCNGVTNKTIASMGSKTLTTINLRRCSLVTSEGIWECLQRCDSLTNLNLAFCSLDVTFVDQLCQFQCLPIIKVLDLSGFKSLTDAHLHQLIENDGFCNSVTTFKLDECTGLTDAGIDGMLRRCTNLQHISLCFCRELTDESFSAMEEGTHHSLLSISVGGCGKFTDVLLRRASHCPKLKELTLAWNKLITDKEIPNLASRCQNLKTVNLSYCHLITDVAIKAIVENCRNIKRLDAGYCPDISIAGFMTASLRLKNLMFLRLMSTCLGAIEEFFVESMKRNCPHLKIEIGINQRRPRCNFRSSCVSAGNSWRKLMQDEKDKSHTKKSGPTTVTTTKAAKRLVIQDYVPSKTVPLQGPLHFRGQTAKREPPSKAITVNAKVVGTCMILVSGIDRKKTHHREFMQDTAARRSMLAEKAKERMTDKNDVKTKAASPGKGLSNALSSIHLEDATAESPVDSPLLDISDRDEEEEETYVCTSSSEEEGVEDIELSQYLEDEDQVKDDSADERRIAAAHFGATVGRLIIHNSRNLLDTPYHTQKCSSHSYVHREYAIDTRHSQECSITNFFVHPYTQIESTTTNKPQRYSIRSNNAKNGTASTDDTQTHIALSNLLLIREHQTLWMNEDDEMYDQEDTPDNRDVGDTTHQGDYQEVDCEVLVEEEDHGEQNQYEEEPQEYYVGEYTEEEIIIPEEEFEHHDHHDDNSFHYDNEESSYQYEYTEEESDLLSHELAESQPEESHAEYHDIERTVEEEESSDSLGLPPPVFRTEGTTSTVETDAVQEALEVEAPKDEPLIDDVDGALNELEEYLPPQEDDETFPSGPPTFVPQEDSSLASDDEEYEEMLDQDGFPSSPPLFRPSDEELSQWTDINCEADKAMSFAQLLEEADIEESAERHETDSDLDDFSSDDDTADTTSVWSIRVELRPESPGSQLMEAEVRRAVTDLNRMDRKLVNILSVMKNTPRSEVLKTPNLSREPTPPSHQHDN
ncbi:hypothetical protein PROFUN_01423 [Planoprotostelium fungivorum]|uniref:F-box/LRR-repeat protein 15-like leucin rich repeat domain-containing protein n=1 Tax=Planoprotostelium fungivorum TaxID=1890364 RepID=A0A2P6NT92_9EUKA|nr:hypothetical protein PROFUN_01423 [Planoprotostelium fungivorum]